MKKLPTPLAILFALAFVLQSCESNAHNAIDQIDLSTAKTGEKKPEIFTDTLEFMSYNDDGDYMLLFAKNGKETLSFINDKNEDRSLLRGDICEIRWKNDTIYISGDGETPEIAEWVISVRKIDDGKVSKYRKEHKKELKYQWFEENNYAQNYMDEMYLLAEYYVANSENELIKFTIQNKEQIEYSVEEQIKNNRHYTVLGIGYMFEHRFTIMQWIYIDTENRKIFEYDLPNDKLINFE